MPVIDNVGYGEYTPLKMEHFSKIVSMHLRITNAVLKKNPGLYRQCYRYIELTAGKGFTPNAEKGSPLVFLEQVEKVTPDLAYCADFIECKEKNIRELETTISREKRHQHWKGTISFKLGKYQDEIYSLLTTKSKKELGLIFVDPSGDLPDFDVLHDISKLRPRMEILIYIPSTNVKRVHQYTDKRLSDLIYEIGKKYWLIRKPIKSDQFKWTFLFGSNTDIFNDYKSINLIRLDSKLGQKILRRT